MIVVDIENNHYTFDIFDIGAGFPSLVETTKAIREHMGFSLVECVAAARKLLKNKSITLSKNG